LREAKLDKSSQITIIGVTMTTPNRIVLPRAALVVGQKFGNSIAANVELD